MWVLQHKLVSSEHSSNDDEQFERRKVLPDASPVEKEST